MAEERRPEVEGLGEDFGDLAAALVRIGQFGAVALAVDLRPRGVVADDGREYSAQTWQLREMVLRGMMAVAA